MDTIIIKPRGLFWVAMHKSMIILYNAHAHAYWVLCGHTQLRHLDDKSATGVWHKHACAVYDLMHIVYTAHIPYWVALAYWYYLYR